MIDQWTVLIASGSPNDRAGLREALLSGPVARYSIMEAETGARALELCRAQKPDCLIFDHSLPDLAGLDLLKQITPNDGPLAFGVVVLVGAGDTRLAIEAMKSGAHDCIEKDRADADEIRRAVNHAIMAALRDDTERRLVEERLRNSEGDFRSLFELSAVGMARVSPEGRYLRVNRKFCQMLGYSEEELLQRTLHEVTHPDDRELSAARFVSSITGEAGEFSIEKRYVRKDGGIIWVLINWRVVRDAAGNLQHNVANIQDITERKQIEEALQESEERLQLAMEAGEIGTFDWNIPTSAIVWTEQSKPAVGRPSGTSRGVYEDWAKRVHPEDLRILEASVQEAFRKKVNRWQAEYRMIDADTGGERWINSQSRMFYDAQGKPLRMIGVNIDMTERRQAEEAIRHSEAQLRELADAMPQIVFTCRPDGTADYINRQAYEYSGGSEEQSMEDVWMGMLHPDDRERTLRQWEESVKLGQAYEVECRLRRKDGQYRWRLSRAIPVRNAQNQIVKWIGTLTDIHDRKEAESEREELLVREQAARAEAEHVAESIRRLQAVTDSALGRFPSEALLREMLDRVRELVETDSAAILLLAEDGKSLVVRAAIGLEEEAIGLHIPVGESMAGSIAASRAPLIVADVSTSPVINLLLRRKARSLIAAPLIVEGRLIGVIHADTTLTRRLTENDVRLLQLAADRVALAIEQTRLYDVEKQARRQAEESNRMKDEFLALVSHELRSPLTAMLGYANLLRFGPLDPQKVRHAVDVIERGGRMQTQLIDDLLDTARIISGKLRLDVGPVNMTSVIEAAVQTVYPAANAKGITIHTNVDPQIGHHITGDPERLQQVAWNLLSNAVKFTPSGGRVEVRLERADPHIRITVSDTGKGITPDFLPYVFDRFRQADTSSARRHGGLGLGLALVKYLVELHGGTMAVVSDGEGQGATFTVLLPVRAVSSPLSETEGEPVTVVPGKDRRLAGVRVLVVDDEDDARELVQTVIAQYGAEVVVAASAAEAFTLITTSRTEKRPHVMVTDLGMPDEDGYSLLRRVREWEYERGLYTPAVALTAYGRSEDRVRALRAGFQMHVAKPAEPAELAVVIASIVHLPDQSEAA